MNSKSIHFISRFRNIFFGLAVMILLASCMDDNENLVSEPVEVAYVSIYHAAPDAPDFDIIVDGRVINSNPFDYSSYSGYLNFFTGNREIRFTATNADNALIDTTFNFQDEKAYSLFAINRLSKIEALLVEDSAAVPSAGHAMVRFVHLSPDAPAFDVAVNENETPLFTGKSFKEATAFQEIAADSYAFNLKAVDGSEVTLTAEGVDILPGRFYTIVVRGFANPPDGNNHILSLEILD